MYKRQVQKGSKNKRYLYIALLSYFNFYNAKISVSLENIFTQKCKNINCNTNDKTINAK